jgi:hypothetical protein
VERETPVGPGGVVGGRLAVICGRRVRWRATADSKVKEEATFGTDGFQWVGEGGLIG